MGVLHLTGLNIRKDIFLGLWERLPMEKSNNLSAFLFYSDSKKKKLHDAFVLKMNYYLLFGNEIYSEKVSWNFGDICQYNFRQFHLLSMKGVNKIFLMIYHQSWDKQQKFLKQMLKHTRVWKPWLLFQYSLIFLTLYLKWILQNSEFQNYLWKKSAPDAK